MRLQAVLSCSTFFLSSDLPFSVFSPCWVHVAGSRIPIALFLFEGLEQTWLYCRACQEITDHVEQFEW